METAALALVKSVILIAKTARVRIRINVQLAFPKSMSQEKWVRVFHARLLNLGLPTQASKIVCVVTKVII